MFGLPCVMGHGLAWFVKNVMICPTAVAKTVQIWITSNLDHYSERFKTGIITGITTSLREC